MGGRGKNGHLNFKDNLEESSQESERTQSHRKQGRKLTAQKARKV